MGEIDGGKLSGEYKLGETVFWGVFGSESTLCMVVSTFLCTTPTAARPAIYPAGSAKNDGPLDPRALLYPGAYGLN